MFCKKCGAELKADAKFCVQCGTAVDGEIKASVETSNSNRTVDHAIPTKKKTLLGAIAAVAVVVFIVVGIVSCSSKEFSVDLVQKSYYEEYDNKKIGKAFEDYFYDTSWEYTKALIGNNEFVTCEGHFQTDTLMEVTCEISFWHSIESDDADEFRIWEIELYGSDGRYKCLTNAEETALLNSIYYGGSFSWEWEY